MIKNLKHAIVSTDIVIFLVKNNILMSIILDVKNKEYKGKKAFPGGLMLTQETAMGSVQRVIDSKLNINPKDVYMEELKAYSELHRDKRGRVVSLAYIGCMHSEPICVTSNPFYFLVDYTKIYNLAYDHNQILKDALQKLKNRFLNSTIAQTLLPKNFTMSELYQLYCLVLNKKIDKRNFIRKINSLNIIKQSTGKIVGQQHRPAQLFTFAQKEIKDLEIF